jgi:hypothetical protein
MPLQGRLPAPKRKPGLAYTRTPEPTLTLAACGGLEVLSHGTQNEVSVRRQARNQGKLNDTFRFPSSLQARCRLTSVQKQATELRLRLGARGRYEHRQFLPDVLSA